MSTLTKEVDADECERNEPTPPLNSPDPLVAAPERRFLALQGSTQVIGTHSGIGLVTKNRYDIAPMNAIPAPASNAGTNDQVCAI